MLDIESYKNTQSGTTEKIYTQKYLKYKNKYIKLKNMIGGDFRSNEEELKSLWNDRNTIGKVFDVTYSKFVNNYSHYCWISGPSYGLGFFLYLLKKDKEPVDGHNKVDKYAVWNMTLNNIGPRNKVNPISDLSLSYKTTIDLPTTYQNIILKKDVTKFDWSHTDDCWVYEQDNNFYKSTLIPIDFDALWKAKEKKKVFDVTRNKLVKNYSHYCWISGPSYGFGFFLYSLRPDKEPVTGHNKVGQYVVFDITLNIIGPLHMKLINKPPLSYKTTIDLPLPDGTKLKEGTPFDWSNEDNGWVYEKSNSELYQSNLMDFDELWARKPKKKVFEVTRPEFVNNYSHYCWISGHRNEYGLGFFLYKLKEGQEPVDGHIKVDNYAVWYITLNNRGPLNLVEINISDRDLDYLTTIDLSTTDKQITILYTGTSFDWSHDYEGWIYMDNFNRKYKAVLIK